MSVLSVTEVRDETVPAKAVSADCRGPVTVFTPQLAITHCILLDKRTGSAIGRPGPAIGRPGPAIGHIGPAVGRPGPAVGRPGPAIGRPGQRTTPFSVSTTLTVA